MTENSPEISPAPIPQIEAPLISSPLVFARKLRWLELALVLAVAFAQPIYSSFYMLFRDAPRAARSPYSDAQIFNVLLSEGAGLAVLCYVLFRQNRSVREFGFRWNPQQIPTILGQAFLLYIAAMGASIFGRVIMAISYYAIFGREMNWQTEKLPDISVTMLAVIFMIVNGAFEELIVRAYAITEMEWLTKNTAFAVVFSVLFQTSYHFYQGAPIALSYAPLFLVFALFYVRTRNVTPVILAHIAIDMVSLFSASNR